MQRFGTWIILGIATLSTTALATEWPKWLGPEGNGISTDKIAEQWPADGPKKLWSQTVGLGYSSVVAVDGKVYFFGMQGANDVLTAMDAGTGKVLWAESSKVGHKPSQNQAANPQNGLPLPDATPTIDADRIYTYGGGGDLIARNLADGKAVWQLNVLDETGAKNLAWSEASSPLVTAKLVYVQGGDGGAAAVAVDKATGKIAWKSEKGLGGYAAPILISAGGISQVIFFGGKTLYSFDPQTGKTIWKQPWDTQYDVNASTPIFSDGHLFITSGYGHGCAMFTISATAAKLDWKGKEISSKFQPCILDNGKLYGNSGGILKCMTWPTKDVVWSSRDVELNEGGSFVIDGNLMIALGEKGKLSLVKLDDPAGPKVVSDMDAFTTSPIWSAPVIYHGKLYIHGKDQLVCLDIGGK
ncbi:MAG TPA: PQQ-binding-like beta-propeller repeat protein [Tepidisphaeraceae bacterium]|jgi:outer membrane protein assembly factor BamB|nr:PQQ-binding-like beta-propeller repeat protein [Tepidisphaeraceae bacterium]